MQWIEAPRFVDGARGGGIERRERPRDARDGRDAGWRSTGTTVLVTQLEYHARRYADAVLDRKTQVVEMAGHDVVHLTRADG
jgi:hypothetical protein